MELKSYKSVQLLYVVVSVSALIVACNTKVTEPLKLMSVQEAVMNPNMVSSATSTIPENYGVPQAQNVMFSSNAQEELQDLTY